VDVAVIMIVGRGYAPDGFLIFPVGNVANKSRRGRSPDLRRSSRSWITSQR